MKPWYFNFAFFLSTFPLGSSQDTATGGGTDNVNVIKLAGIFDTTEYDWSPDIFDITVELINRGWWDALPNTLNYRLEYTLENSNCDETTAARSWWKTRTANGDQPVDGLVGARCSGATVALARLSGLEQVPQISPASNAATLSNKEEFPFFSRLVAPNNEHGEVGAVIAMLRSFGWSKITILNTDTVFAKDWANNFKKNWVGEHHDVSGEWKGSVYSETLRLTPNGTIEAESIRQTLQAFPADGGNGRIVLLAAHSQHAFEVLEEAAKIRFRPDAIWIGGSSWASTYPDQDLLWTKNRVPGYLGVAPFQHRDEDYDAFLSELQSWQSARGKLVTTELPLFARETVDSIRAMAQALAYSENKRDGKAVVSDLRDLKFNGISGWVEFTKLGDRKDPLYSIYNAHSMSEDGTFSWKEVGQSGTKIGSVIYEAGLRDICFAEAGCSLDTPPSDSYPEPPLPVPGWTIPVIVAIACVLIFFAYRYLRTKSKKHAHKTELQALQQSVAGMRTAEANYIPLVTKAIDLEEQALDRSTSERKRADSIVGERAKWMWQETPGYIGNHDVKQIYGDPNDSWILYSDESTVKLEEAYRRKKPKVSPLFGYEVNLKTMTQINLATKFERQVQRVVDGASSREMSLNDVDVGDKMPADLEGEARMVLVKGDVVQISKSRPHDDWRFGTKLHSADETTARRLVEVACDGGDPDKDNIFHDSGWFQLGKTRMPTAEDLQFIKENVGQHALAQPKTWIDMKDPSVAEKHPLPLGHERNTVMDAFLKTLNRSRTQIVKVERIQNLAMWQSYVVKRQTICNRDIKKRGVADDQTQQQKQIDRFERAWLFHGTNFEVMDKILQQGFNRSFCGKNATMYGKGVYFAVESSYSACSTYAVPDRNGFQYVMACRVAVGEYCLGKRDALTPDVRDSKTNTLYDSTVNALNNPTVFVTYHDAQAYPEYLITFKQT